MQKGDQKTVTLSVLKVASSPRTFGENGKAWEITCLENELPGEDHAFKLETYAQNSLQPLQALVGQGPKEMTIEYVNTYQEVDGYKLVKIPGWEKGQGGGGQRTFPPDAEGRAIYIGALQAAASQMPQGSTGDVKLAEATKMLAEHYAEDIIAFGVEYAKKKGASQPQQQASSNGSGSRTDYNRLVAALTTMWKESDPSASESDVKASVVKPFCDQEGLHFPPADDELDQVNAHLNDLVVGNPV